MGGAALVFGVEQRPEKTTISICGKLPFIRAFILGNNEPVLASSACAGKQLWFFLYANPRRAHQLGGLLREL